MKAVRPDLAFLPSNFNWFLPQLAVGGDGILSGLASLTPHWLIDLWRAAQARDLEAMRAASDRLYPIVRTIYGAPPLIDMHTRIKVGLKKLGLIAERGSAPAVDAGSAGDRELRLRGRLRRRASRRKSRRRPELPDTKLEAGMETTVATTRNFNGIYASTVCPLQANGAIDEQALDRHLRDVLDGTGMRGLLLNGHAGENAMLQPRRAAPRYRNRTAASDAII